MRDERRGGCGELKYDPNAFNHVAMGQKDNHYSWIECELSTHIRKYGDVFCRLGFNLIP
jgi:hypothetical protein